MCTICLHPSASKINEDLKELCRLREGGRNISLTWFTEVHCKEEYGIEIGRESMKRHAHKTLGIKV